MSDRPDPLKIVAVCGLGMGSSLILTMTVEAAVKKLGINATVGHGDVAAAAQHQPDVVVGHKTHVDEVAGLAPVSVVVEDFVDDEVLADRMKAALRAQGWL